LVVVRAVVLLRLGRLAVRVVAAALTRQVFVPVVRGHRGRATQVAVTVLLLACFLRVLVVVRVPLVLFLSTTVLVVLVVPVVHRLLLVLPLSMRVAAAVVCLVRGVLRALAVLVAGAMLLTELAATERMVWVVAVEVLATAVPEVTAGQG
jgi:hypothetical protein